MAIEGYINVQSPLIPNNDNPRGFTTENKYVKGGPQVFSDVNELVAFHPARMKAGMPATILNWPTAGTITDFRLNAEPSSLINAVNESIVTTNNFQEFWIISSQTQAPKNRVYQYAADAPGGGMPVWPYTVENEYVWENILNPSKGHRWVRTRDDDIKDPVTGIFTNWSTPTAIGAVYQGGDYIENKFKRQAVDTSIHTSSSTLVLGKYYLVQSNSITITGPNIEDCEIGEYGETTTAILTSGRTFKYVAGNTYTFGTGTVQEIIQAPPRSLDGLPNNDPVGWTDTIPTTPAGEQLWQITAQKSIYGQLKSAWVLKMIVESPDFIRYSNSPSPHPDTLAGVNDNASTEPTNGNLTAAGWVSVYNEHVFIARRDFDPGPNVYLPWVVEKISEESGEYVDHVYKLFDLNMDTGSVPAPVNRDPAQEGWNDTPQIESDTKINYVSQARKFFDGELKSPWSQPVPYTGQDVFIDAIDSDLGDNFKYDSDGVTVDPVQLVLTAKLFKGVSKLWENVALNITYVWTRVYNNGDPDSTVADSDDSKDFYLLPAAAPIRANQRIVVKDTGIMGTGIFQAKQIFELSPGNNLEFIEEFSILDVTDGLDAKSFDIKADSQRVIYNSSGGGSFVPASVFLRAYWSNIVPAALYWYRWTGTSWLSVNSNPSYVISGNTMSAASSVLFTSSSSSEEITYAVSTHPTNPDSADYETHFSDYVTVGKLSSVGVGAPGEDAILALLTNEAHTLVLDTLTGLPQTDQLTLAYTNVEVYRGETKLIYLVDYTVGLYTEHLPGVNPVTFGLSTLGGDAHVQVTAWGSFEKSAVCSITINIGSNTMLKQFAVTSTQDAPGTLILDLDSDKGFIFDSSDSSNKLLTANLYVGDATGTNAFPLPNGAIYEFRFKVANVWDVAFSPTNTKTIARSAILVNGNVTCEVRRTGEATAFASRTVKFTDVLDGKTYRSFTQATAQPTTGNFLTNQNPKTAFGASPTYPTGVVTGTNTWYIQASAFWTSNPNTQVWEQESEEYVDTDMVAKWRWSSPKKIKGESGSQGDAGNFLFPMFRGLIPVEVNNPSDPAYTTPPALGAGGNTSTLAQMIAAGWLSKMPAVGVIWEATRHWIGQGVIFNASTGDPSTGPVTNSVWNPPVRKTGGAGVAGPSVTGPAGPGYNGTTYVGQDGSGGNIYNLTPVGGAAPAQIVAPKGAQGVATPNTWTGWTKVAQNGTDGTWLTLTTAQPGTAIWVDTGDTTSKNLILTAYMDSNADVAYRMALRRNSSPTVTGSSIITSRIYKTYQQGGSSPTQYQLMFYLTSAVRYMGLEISTVAGNGSVSIYGITVNKIP